MQPVELGKFRIFSLIDCYFRLDGGSMFGIVPKTLWAKNTPPDVKNRIQLVARMLLLEANDQWILIDTGVGEKFDQKLNEIFQIQRERTLEQQMNGIGIQSSDIRVVINSHLHWDHAGGNTIVDQSTGKSSPAFVNARYVIQRGELEFARHTNERTRGSYRPADFEGLNGMLDLVDGDATIAPGVKVLKSGGHVPSHQCVLLESDSRKAFFLGDLLPTHFHIPYPYIMGYDLDPLTTLERKKEYLQSAEQEDWLLFFVHDPEIAFGKVEKQQQGYKLKDGQ